MNTIRTKAIRFFINVLLYAGVLMTATYYIYVYEPQLLPLKNLLLPLGGAMLISTILAIALAAINEIMTFTVVKIMMRKGIK